MNNRNVAIATLLTAVLVTGYQMRELSRAGISEAARTPVATPELEAAPSLRPAQPGQSGIAKLEVWNLKPAPALSPVNLPPLKDLFKPFYSLSKDGRFESIKRSDRPNEQWQFQGVLVRDGNVRALFYNPGLKRLKNLGRGDLVDERLKIASVGASSVTLEVTGEKKPQKFELRLFNANKESYVAKRKTR